jgi:hypothetical protein
LITFEIACGTTVMLYTLGVTPFWSFFFVQSYSAFVNSMISVAKYKSYKLAKKKEGNASRNIRK